jgi:hypothetical protein
MSEEIPRKKVDEDWKRRALQEKSLDAEKAGEKPAAGSPAGAAPAGGVKAGKPSPLFANLVESLASQALMFMGAMRDPMTGQAHQDLHQAQAMIDMLTMLEEKTQGNLVAEEKEMLKQVLDEVRMHFVRLASPPPPRGPKGPMMGNAPRA